METPNYSTQNVAPGHRQKSPGTAVASLILGLLSFIFSIFTGIAAVICGHKALNKINRSGGIMDGKGMAITGLVTGYLSIASLFIVVPIFAGLAVPVFARIQENGQMTMEMQDAREILLSIESYKSNNDGNYPDSLQELVENYDLPSDLVIAPLSSAQNPGGQRFTYIQPNSEATGDTPLVISNHRFSSSRRIVGTIDTVIEVKNYPEEPTQ